LTKGDVTLDSAVKVKVGMLSEHNKRPGEYGYNETITRYFEYEGDFFEAWGESWPDGMPTPVDDEGDNLIVHKRFGTVYVNDDGVPVACVSVEECSVEEAMKNSVR
jgi:hypothetical protein